MQTARRIYVYLMTGISLGALVTGLVLLLGVLLDRVGLGPTGEVVFGGEESIREELTVATALVAVSLPVWLIHWLLAERSVRPDRPGGPAELDAAVRGLFFALVLGALLAFGAFGVASALEGAILRVVRTDTGFRDVGGDLALGVVTLGAWAYHARIRDRDWRRRTMTGFAASLPRAYRYLATVVGLLVALVGITGLLELLGRVLLDQPTPVVGDDGPWWSYPLVESISAIVVGGAIWVGHWMHGARLVVDPSPRGTSERESRLRLAAFVAVLVMTATGTLLWLGIGIGAAIALLLGVSDAVGGTEAVGSVVVPLLSAVPFAVAGWLHARWLDGEPIAIGGPAGAATVDRLRIYPVALVGLAFAAVGTAWLLDVAVDGLFGQAGLGGGQVWRRQLAQFAPFALLGWGAWGWRWTAAVRREAADRSTEATSTTRRGTLLVALAVAILAGIGAAGTILYRLFGSLFGLDLADDPISALSLPIGILVVAVAVGGWHGAILRADGRWREEATEVEPTTEDRTVRLRLSGPRSGIDAALASLRSATPPGYDLREEREDDAPG